MESAELENEPQITQMSQTWKRRFLIVVTCAIYGSDASVFLGAFVPTW